MEHEWLLAGDDRGQPMKEGMFFGHAPLDAMKNAAASGGQQRLYRRHILEATKVDVQVQLAVEFKLYDALLRAQRLKHICEPLKFVRYGR